MLTQGISPSSFSILNVTLSSLQDTWRKTQDHGHKVKSSTNRI